MSSIDHKVSITLHSSQTYLCFLNLIFHLYDIIICIEMYYFPTRKNHPPKNYILHKTYEI